MSNKNPNISFEFFPPKTEEAKNKLYQILPLFEQENPDYISVTYGAGGTTKDSTFSLIKHIKNNSSLDPAAHLTCVGANRTEINGIALNYLENGIKRIVALRGDMPGMKGPYIPNPDGYAYADNLVSGLLEIGNFDISVAAYPETHPQALSENADLDHLKRKQDAGANRAITQYCFDTNIILEFLEKSSNKGVSIPIIPGIMMISNFSQVANFSARCGATIPKWLIDKFEKAGDSEEEQHKVAVEVAYEQCEILVKNKINDFHFYTLNQAKTSLEVTKLVNQL